MSEPVKTLKITYKGKSYAWKGVLKNAQGETVWECGHLHKNRDQSTTWVPNAQAYLNTSARDCAKAELIRMQTAA